ncbi:putative Mg2+ transporter-C (MgtC) family protein [Angulomicrobium tetraedrale]|uniref:Protein MgtC n=1 Tax=Ancylobacter tetraedralis TaxID=217068 RepID=A0A839Z585_9HYPH|nr:MgtC/SapB family protein [Ancylobacter tetraedralis]MBB3769660.1 putative Mg2+ transporter-C (MgtC) family protein [Ancylobacter tetraedralis]
MDLMSPHDIEALFRLLVAAVCGMLIGINRDLRGKPTGMRTLGLVAMGAALVALTAMRVDGIAGHPDATSRVVQGIIQGIMTGIGFLGAGVVLHKRHSSRVHGLTTAATVWVTAALGIACALASWHLIVMGIAVTLMLLVLALPIERFIEARAGVPVRRHGATPPASGDAPLEPPPPPSSAL